MDRRRPLSVPTCHRCDAYVSVRSIISGYRVCHSCLSPAERSVMVEVAAFNGKVSVGG
jgi:hypothetical protein